MALFERNIILALWVQGPLLSCHRLPHSHPKLPSVAAQDLGPGSSRIKINVAWMDGWMDEGWMDGGMKDGGMKDGWRDEGWMDEG